MAKRVIKVKAGEKLSEENVKAVIKALSGDTPCSKKDACGMLNIAYNTTRLNNIIEDYNSKVLFRRKQRAAVRKTPVSMEDKRNVVEAFVAGEALNEIVKSSFRSMHVIKTILKEFSLPLRVSADSTTLIEDPSEDYEKGDLVYSAKYNEYCEIVKRLPDSADYGAVYHIYVLGSHCQFAYQPYYELIDLRKAQDELNLQVTSLTGISPRPLPKGYA